MADDALADDVLKEVTDSYEPGWPLDEARLATRRLAFFLPGTAEPAEVADFFARNRAYHKDAWGDRDAEYYTAEYQREKMRSDKVSYHFKLSARFFFALADERRVIGLVSLNQIDDSLARLAYIVDEAEAGKGFATEAAAHVVGGIAFGVMKLHRVETGIMPRNAVSKRVAEKCGFAYEGLLREYLKINGVWENHEMWSIINEQEG